VTLGLFIHVLSTSTTLEAVKFLPCQWPAIDEYIATTVKATVNCIMH